MNTHTCLGIELGSTRIKAVLTDQHHRIIAQGAFDWENSLTKEGYWTYALSDAIAGVQKAYQQTADEYRSKIGQPLSKIDAIGISAMMHGYLPFDKNMEQLADFRTWRNTNTKEASEKLTELFSFAIPQRWSIAHLYQAILNNKEEHVRRIAHLTTLAGYLHYRLTGRQCVGCGEASGMFPIDPETVDGHHVYDRTMAAKFNDILNKEGLPYQIEDILPQILDAGEDAGSLTPDGALLLDPTGTLRAGSLLCPCEGDAGTGMCATDSVLPRTGNVSAGTSIFAMIVLEKPLSRPYAEVDMVTTPDGKPTAMVHCNTCTSDLDAWIRLFGEFSEKAGLSLSKADLYKLFYQQALSGAKDGGGLLSYDYYAGEPVTGIESGSPLMMRRPDAVLDLPNFCRSLLYSAVSTLAIGMKRLSKNEGIKVDTLMCHGGLFKQPLVGQQMVASALRVQTAVMETAGEGGPWGMALLASYRLQKDRFSSLAEYLAKDVFADAKTTRTDPDPAEADGFDRYLDEYQKGLAAEKAAAQVFQTEKE